MWKHTSYIRKGLSHEAAGTKCQDSVIVKEDSYCIVAALADGLGSLKYSDIAANTATETVWALFSSVQKRRIPLGSNKDKQTFAAELVREVCEKIEEKAAELGVSSSTMDCTLVFAYISKVHNYAITGRLGDSAICVIKDDGSIAINDSNQSANGTCAVLDKDAYQHMELSIWDIDKDKIQGFILTSDGLDNELYRKGSLYVNKAAEDYFNSVVLFDEPKQYIHNKIAELTADKDSPFDDDISIAVVNRSPKAIEFPEDPTWLCTCGARNRLQDTYCYRCNKDFSILYQNVRFREFGGKTAFFLEINQKPEEERKLIEPSVPQEKPAPKTPEGRHRTGAVHSEVNNPTCPPPVPVYCHPAPQEPVNTPPVSSYTAPNSAEAMQTFSRNSRHSVPKNHVILLVSVIVVLIIGLSAGFLFSKHHFDQALQQLSEKDKVAAESTPATSEVEANPSDATDAGTEPSGASEAETSPTDGSDPSDASEPEDESTPPESSEPLNPDETLQPDENSSWGSTQDGVLHGYGFFLKNGNYYFGNFEEGKKEGTFWIVPKDAPEYATSVSYDNDEMQMDSLTLDKYFISESYVKVRVMPGTENEALCTLKRGAYVYKTSRLPVTHDGKEWCEIIYDGVIGWVNINAIKPVKD